jgi:hypothetical protein
MAIQIKKRLERRFFIISMAEREGIRLYADNPMILGRF